MLALAVRLGGSLWWQIGIPEGKRFTFGDSEGYWALGQAIANGQPYQYGSPDASVRRMPGYPLILAGVFELCGADAPVFCARAVNGLLGALAVLCVFWLGKSAFDASVGLAAAGIAAVYPGAIGMSVFVLSEAPFSPLLAVQLAATQASWRATAWRKSAGWSALAGLAAGLATYMRPSWIAFLPFLAVCGLWGVGRWRRLAGTCLAMAVCATVLTPWWFRNYRVVGRFVPTTLSAGESLYDGLHDGATGGSDMSFVPAIERAERFAPTRPKDEPFECRLDARLAREAWAWARANPGRVASLASNKLARFWSPWPHDTPIGWPLKAVLIAAWLPVTIGGACGAWRFRAAGWPCWVCLAPAAYFSLLHLVFVASTRYREPAMLPWIVLAASWMAGATPREARP